MTMAGKGEARKNLRLLRKRWDEYVYYLGQLAYKALQDGRIEDEEMRAAYETLLEIERLIGYWEGVLAAPPTVSPAPAGVVRCLGCGTILPPGALHCSVCGARIGGEGVAVSLPSREASPPVPPAAMPAPTPGPEVTSCPRCSTVLEPDARFCPRCGNPVSTGVVTGEPPGLTAPEPEEPEQRSQPASGVETQAVGPGEITAEGRAGEGSGTVPVTQAGEATTLPASGALKCPSCGSEVEEPGARFCPHCGSGLG